MTIFIPIIYVHIHKFPHIDLWRQKHNMNTIQESKIQKYTFEGISIKIYIIANEKSFYGYTKIFHNAQHRFKIYIKLVCILVSFSISIPCIVEPVLYRVPPPTLCHYTVYIHTYWLCVSKLKWKTYWFLPGKQRAGKKSIHSKLVLGMNQGSFCSRLTDPDPAD